MKLQKRLAEAFKPAVDLIYPPRCPLCGDAIADQTGVCAECWPKIVIPGSPACSTCQRPLRNTTGDAKMQCAACLADPPVHDGIAAATLYNNASRKLILALKHGKRIALAEMLGKLMAARLPDCDEKRLCIPVPLHRSRIWMRGFNQAALLAGQVARQSGQELLIDGLTRTKRTQPLGGLGRTARERTLSGSIAINPRRAQNIAGAHVILIDDVLTSGATSEACVKALKRAGAESVLICCFARVLDDVTPPDFVNFTPPEK